MYCPSCGTQLKLQARFCEHCGADASSAALRRPIRADYETKMSEPARCAGCGGDLHPGDRFCERCGKQVERVQLRRPKCVVCGAPLEDDAVFCVSCGMEYRPDAEGPLERTGADGKPECLRPCCPECHTPLTELSDHCTGCGLDLKHLRRRTVRLVDENGKLTCPVCGAAGQPANRRVCWSCGASFEKAEQGGAVFCRFCGRSYPAQLGACPHCRTPAPGVAGFRAPAPEPEPPKSPEELAREREAEERRKRQELEQETKELKDRYESARKRLATNGSLDEQKGKLGLALGLMVVTSIMALAPAAELEGDTLGVFDLDGFTKILAILGMLGAPLVALIALLRNESRLHGMICASAILEVMKVSAVLAVPFTVNMEIDNSISGRFAREYGISLPHYHLTATGIFLVLFGIVAIVLALIVFGQAKKNAEAAELDERNVRMLERKLRERGEMPRTDAQEGRSADGTDL